MAKYYGPDLAVVTRVTTDNTPSGHRRFLDHVRYVPDGAAIGEYAENTIYGRVVREQVGASYTLHECDGGGNPTLPLLRGYLIVHQGTVHVKPAEYRRILKWGM